MRTYPITQRPDYCLLNPVSPLARGLMFGGFGLMGCYGSNQHFDSGLGRNHGTLAGYSGAPTWSKDLGRSVLAITTNNYVTAPINTIMAGATAAWISAWMYKPVSASQSNVVGFGSSAGDNYAFFIDWYSNGSVYFEVNNGSANNATFSQSSGGWIHAFLQFNGNLTGNARISGYINGVAGSLSYSGTPAATLAPAVSLGTAIAGKENAGATSIGKIADLIIGLGVVPVGAIKCLADPSNVLLEVAGVPLLLPAWNRTYKGGSSRRRRFLLGV